MITRLEAIREGLEEAMQMKDDADAAICDSGYADLSALLSVAEAVETLLADEDRYQNEPILRRHAVAKRLHQLRLEMAPLLEEVAG